MEETLGTPDSPSFAELAESQALDLWMRIVLFDKSIGRMGPF